MLRRPKWIRSITCSYGYHILKEIQTVSLKQQLKKKGLFQCKKKKKSSGIEELPGNIIKDCHVGEGIDVLYRLSQCLEPGLIDTYNREIDF